MLAECGVSAKLSADGRVELSDGRIVGHYCEAVGDSPGNGEDDDFEDPLEAITGGASGGAGGRGSHGSNERLVRKVATLQRESDMLRRRLVELRGKSDANNANFELKLRDQEHDLRATAAVAQSESDKQKRVVGLAVEGAVAALQAHNIAHEHEVKNLVNRSDEILRQQAQLASIRAGLPQHQQQQQYNEDSQFESSAGGYAKIPGSLSRTGKMRAAAAAAEFSKNAEIELLKQQYEHWLSMRDVEAGQFVDQFNKYRVKNKAKLKTLESDLLRVFSYSQSLKKVLDNMERGEYPLRNANERVLVPCIPNRDMPREIHLLENQPPSHGDDSAWEVALPLHLPGLRAVLRRKITERKLAKDLGEMEEDGSQDNEVNQSATLHALESILAQGNDKGDGQGYVQGASSPYLQGAFAQAHFRTKQSIDTSVSDERGHIGISRHQRRSNVDKKSGHRKLSSNQHNGDSSSEEEVDTRSTNGKAQGIMEIEEVVAMYSDPNVEKLERQGELKSALKSLRNYIEVNVPEKVFNYNTVTTKT